MTRTITLEFNDHDALDAIAEACDATLIRFLDRALLTMPADGARPSLLQAAGRSATPAHDRPTIRPVGIRVPADLTHLADLDMWSF